MKIEHAIQTKGFSSEEQRALINLIYTHNWLQSRSQQFFKKHGLTYQQYNVMRILRGQQPNPASIQLIKERMLDKQSDASRIVDRLLKAKYVKRTISKIDKRVSDVWLSNTGVALMAALDNEIDDQHKMMTSLNNEELQLLNNLLDKLRND
jgi:MarR family multiple gene transcriptional regulator MgrA